MPVCIELEEKHLQTLFFTSVYFSILDFQAIKNQLEFFYFLVNIFFFFFRKYFPEIKI